MNPKQTRTENGVIDRRSFCAVTGVAALATLAIPRAKAATAVPGAEETTMKVQTGNGEWTYEVVSGWGQLPAGIAFGGTHGAITTDNERKCVCEHTKRDGDSGLLG